jgi:hypothetical protein
MGLSQIRTGSEIVPILETLVLFVPKDLCFRPFPVVPGTAVIPMPEPESLQEIKWISIGVVIIPWIGIYGMAFHDPALQASAFRKGHGDIPFHFLEHEDVELIVERPFITFHSASPFLKIDGLRVTSRGGILWHPRRLRAAPP